MLNNCSKANKVAIKPSKTDPECDVINTKFFCYFYNYFMNEFMTLGIHKIDSCFQNREYLLCLNQNYEF